jgi:hypothetical protein
MVRPMCAVARGQADQAPWSGFDRETHKEVERAAATLGVLWILVVVLGIGGGAYAAVYLSVRGSAVMQTRPAVRTLGLIGGVGLIVVGALLLLGILVRRTGTLEEPKNRPAEAPPRAVTSCRSGNLPCFPPASATNRAGTAAAFGRPI